MILSSSAACTSTFSSILVPQYWQFKKVNSPNLLFSCCLPGEAGGGSSTSHQHRKVLLYLFLLHIVLYTRYLKIPPSQVQTLVLDVNDGGTPSDDLVIGGHGEYLGVAVESLRFPFGHVYYSACTVHLGSPGYVVNLIVVQYRQSLKEQEKEMNTRIQETKKESEKKHERKKKEQKERKRKKRTEKRKTSEIGTKNEKESK